MKERGILMSGPMVKALLSGVKTQTRRVVNWDKIAKQSGCTKGTLKWSTPFNSWAVYNGNGEAHLCLVSCPYGVIGDRLYVKETFYVFPGDSVSYKATDDKVGQRWKPSIFMPRWASRITLEITGVKVERLQNISNGDVKAEGLRKQNGLWAWPGYVSGSNNPIYAYELLWDLINEKKHPWSSNPFCWVISFQVLSPRPH